MRATGMVLWVIGLALLSADGVWSAGSPQLRLKAVRLARPVIRLFERCELTMELEGMASIANPYDPGEVTIEATFESSRGHPVVVTGFYYQPMTQERRNGQELLTADGDPVWKVRFTPRTPGFWSYAVRVIARQADPTIVRGTFEVTGSAHRGFVKLDRASGMFRFENGQPFIPIGENVAWATGTRPLQTYEQWFRELSQQRANYIRVWLAPWSLRLETKDTGVGRYDQLRAWQLDHLLEESEKKGLYWQLCLLDHGSFSRTQDPQWQNNPYNEQVGGMCRAPDEFMTDARAQAAFRQLLRYLVSRWGYSPTLASWELFNEVDLSEIRPESFTPWIAQMSQSLQALDVNRRPVTVSFHHRVPEAVGKLPTIDTIQVHLYDQRDFAGLFCGSMIRDLQKTFQKPVMIGEFGWITDFVRQIDREGIHFHDGLWASVMGGATGSALVWYWDTYVHPNQLHRHLRPLAMFWRGERLNAPLQRLELSLSDPDVVACGVGTPQRAYVWMKNRTHNFDQYLAYRCEQAKQRLQEARGQSAQPSLQYPPRMIQGAKATVGGLAAVGRYRVEWWDPYRGQVLKTQINSVHWGKLTLDVPDVTFDVAGKLTRIPWWEGN